MYPDHGTEQPERFIWEVCKWPRWHGFDWVFICWKIDGTGMWMKQFSTKREAQAFFPVSGFSNQASERRSPSVVALRCQLAKLVLQLSHLVLQAEFAVCEKHSLDL